MNSERGISCHVEACERHNRLQFLGLLPISKTLADKVDGPWDELLEQLDEFFSFRDVGSVVDPFLPVRLISEVLWVNVDHATARDGCR